MRYEKIANAWCDKADELSNRKDYFMSFMARWMAFNFLYGSSSEDEIIRIQKFCSNKLRNLNLNPDAVQAIEKAP